jgi:hypothetical protein
MLHNTLDVKKKVNMTLMFDLTRSAFFELGKCFPIHYDKCIFISILYT